MRLITAPAELQSHLEEVRADGRRVGFVPTMGALHRGHASLVERGAAEVDEVVVSIYVNPLQFGPAEDLAAYPRDLHRDATGAERAGATVVFAPPVDAMGRTATRIRVEGLGDVLEGVRRPGHLEGVATVVAKLFGLVGRCRAYFGEKDFQQLAVVRRMAADLSFPVEVVGCPTQRDHDGLALSSRNAYLTPDERDAAPVVHRALRAGAASAIAGERNAATVAALVGDIVEAEPLASLESVDVVAAATLEPLDRLTGDVRILAAVRFGKARLIDNLGVVIR